MRKTNLQRGQSLLETIGAIFILTMALTTMLGVIIYALSRSSVSQKEIMALNLAREGIDVVRMMRDTNWLEGDKDGSASFGLDSDCGANPPNGQNGAQENYMDSRICYPSWMQGPNGGNYSGYIIDPSQLNNADNSRLVYAYNPNNDTPTWLLERANGQRRFHLCLMSDGSFQHSNACDNNTNPPFARRINITAPNIANPYTPRNPQMRVVSVVVWSDKNCPSINNQNPLTLATPCKVVTEELMTNWKDYR